MLTTEEKIRLVTGQGSWHTADLPGKLPPQLMCDGPHGIRKQKEGASNNDSEPATCYPTASCLASSFDLDLAYKVGASLGAEAFVKGLTLLLGPGVNMKRSPLCGRNFEYFSEDPLLAGKLAAAWIQGLQYYGVGASLKHFTGNSQERFRMISDSVIDERTLREFYLRAFEIAVREARPATVMASYNRLNGTYASQNRWLLTDVLRRDWGFDGAVISDWGACTDLTESLKAGMDLEMPDSHGIHGSRLEKALADEDTQRSLDRAVENIVSLAMKYGPVFPPSYVQHASQDGLWYDDVIIQPLHDTEDAAKSRHDLSRLAAEGSAVLLQNDGILPIEPDDQKGIRILLIGDLAVQTRYQGGGSSHVNATDVPSLKAQLETCMPQLQFARGYDAGQLEPNTVLEEEALAMADQADLILVAGGLTDLAEGEGFDRDSYEMPENQRSLIRKLAEKNAKMVLISYSGSPYAIECQERWNGILQMYLAGEASAEAAANLLTGKVNPSGHLAETWPRSIEDTPAYGNFSTDSKRIVYRERMMAGYRHYVTNQVETAYAFGWGLSYTHFTYEDLRVSEDGKTVTCKCKNIGTRPGATVVQLYIDNPQGAFLRPLRELRAFCKVHMQPGEERTLQFELEDRAYACWDTVLQQWVVPSGTYRIEIGENVNDILLSKELHISGVTEFHDCEVSAELPSEKVPGPYTRTNSIRELSERSIAAKLLAMIGKSVVKKMCGGKDERDPEVRMMLESMLDGTIESVVIAADGKIPYRLVDICVRQANRGRRFKR